MIWISDLVVHADQFKPGFRLAVEAGAPAPHLEQRQMPTFGYNRNDVIRLPCPVLH
jgi:hypothetical protein